MNCKNQESQKRLLILGAGQYGQVAYETAEAMGCFERIDFLDDQNPIGVGKLTDYNTMISDYNYAFVAIGNPNMRLELLQKLEKCGYELAVLIHPKGYVSKSAYIAEGSIVEPMAVVQAGARVERGVLLCAGCVVNHNSTVQQGCQIDCNAVVSARGTVREKTKVSCGDVVFPL